MMNDVCFNEDRELVANYDIVNFVVFPNHSAVRVNVGLLQIQASLGPELTIIEGAIIWPEGTNQVRNFYVFVSVLVIS